VKQTLRDIAIMPSSISATPSDKLLLPSQYMGVEVEVENVDWRDWRQDEPGLARAVEAYWSVEEDGSLRNKGIELVSRPYFGQDLLNALQVLEAGLPAYASWSLRTSVHVHLDVRDLEPRQLLSMVYMYIFLERVLFAYAPDRVDSQYCVPWFCSKGGVDGVIHCLQIENSDGLLLYLDVVERYTAFNLKAVRKYATVEVRHLGGTNNYTFLVKWINLLMGIRKAAEYPAEEILKCVTSPSLRMGLLTDIYGSLLGLVDGVLGFEAMLRDGAINLREIMARVEYIYGPDIDQNPIETSSYVKLRKHKRRTLRQKKPDERKDNRVMVRGIRFPPAAWQIDDDEDEEGLFHEFNDFEDDID
jgi:hypothetical protein